MGEDGGRMPSRNELRCAQMRAGLRVVCACLALGALGLAPLHAAAPAACRRAAFSGEVKAGSAWSTPIGMGWVFRILPIQPASAGYSGWDLVVDRAQPAGFPDALLLATPPYNSINEREIGTTFGLRAQDAIGWNPRTFSFILDPGALRLAQSFYLELQRDGAFAAAHAANQQDATAMSRLLDLQKHAARGEFDILDARIVPGAADAAPYAQSWSLAASKTPHEAESAGPGAGSPRGSLRWMRFAVTLWLPETWKLPPGVRSVAASCP